MKKLLSVALAVLMMASMAACGGSKKTTIAEGKLTVGTSADFAPYEFHILDENGKDKIVGFDMAIAEAIAKDMGLELVIKDMSFDAIIMEINAGTIDMGIAGFSPDEERKKAVDFTDIYYTGGQSIMINKANVDKYKTIEDLNKAELSVGAQTGSIQEKLAKENTPNAKYVGLQAVPNIIMELSSGKVDAIFMETVVGESYAKTQENIMVLAQVPYDAEGSAIAVKKGNTALIEAANKTIKKLKEDGSIGKFVEEANALSSKAVG